MRNVERTERLAARLTPMEMALVKELAERLNTTKTAAVMTAVEFALKGGLKEASVDGEEEGTN